MGSQLVYLDVRIVDLSADSVDELIEIVRRDISSHPHCDPGGTVHQQIG